MATRSAAPEADCAREQSGHPLDRALASALQSTIAGAGVGVELWNGVRTATPGTERGALVIRDRRALLGLLLDPDLQFGECYSDGRLDVRGEFGDVIDALSLNARRDRLSLRERWALVTERAEGLRAARRNIHRHYDIGNAFYRLWLDPELVYTCAYYSSAAATLEQAQTAKLDLVCRKVRLQRGDSVIDAGCGWGALARHMAKRYGARVRAFNISREQIEFARAAAAREGISDRVEFVEDDYRNIT